MKVYVPIAKEGYPFIFLGGVVSVIACLWGKAISIVPFSMVLFLIYFFRDPERIIPKENKGIISPADGKVISIDEHFENRFLKERVVKISIFMSLWDVHINRIPLDGKITDVLYKAGKFFAAFTDKASNLNEHNAILLKTGDHRYILLIQIAGIIARRIVCRIKTGDEVTRGQKFGMICFGSRVEIYLPSDTQLKIRVGEHVKGGETILGDLP